jgi:hypothetical protein
MASRSSWLIAATLCAALGAALAIAPEPAHGAPAHAAPAIAAPVIAAEIELAAQTDLADETAGTVRVDVETSLGPVGKYVYGVNYGPYGAVPFDLYGLPEAAGFGFIRFPGGHWGDVNDIQPYQIDTLVAFARLGGAEPSVHVRLLGGAPERAAALVRYANVERGYGIRYWYIGNEPSLYRDYDVDTLNAQWRPIALAMREVDPGIVLIGPEPHQWAGLPGIDPVDRDGREWVRGLPEANGDLVDIGAVHRYPFPRSAGGPGTTVDDLRRSTAEWERLVSRLRALAREVTGRDGLRFAVTEANSHWSATIGGEATNDSAFNAIWWADVLGKLIVDGAHVVAYFDLHSSDARGGWGLFSNTGVRPAYHVYTLYREFGDDLLDASTSAPHVSAYAARRREGALTLLVTNLADDPQTVRLAIEPAPGPLQLARLLDTDGAPRDVHDPRRDDGTVLDLPARSVTLLVFGGATP